MDKLAILDEKYRAWQEVWLDHYRRRDDPNGHQAPRAKADEAQDALLDLVREIKGLDVRDYRIHDSRYVQICAAGREVLIVFFLGTPIDAVPKLNIAAPGEVGTSRSTICTAPELLSVIRRKLRGETDAIRRQACALATLADELEKGLE